MSSNSEENRIAKDKNVLIVLNNHQEINEELQYLIDNFCGIVVYDLKADFTNKKIYFCGDLHNIGEHSPFLNIIKEFSVNDENISEEKSKVISVGEVPVIVSNSGVYFRKLFHDENIFEKVCSEHHFQQLTESDKESKALRKGIYLSQVTNESDRDGEEELHFNLLRCSSNLTVKSLLCSTGAQKKLLGTKPS